MTHPDHILPQWAQMTHPDHILPQKPAQMTHPDYLYSLCPLFFNLLFFIKTFLVVHPACF